MQKPEIKKEGNMKNIFFLFVMSCFCIFVNSSFAQSAPVEVNKVTAQGTITELAADGTYIVVSEGAEAVKFMTTKEFLEDASLEVGDTIKVQGEKVSGVVKLVDYEYVFEGGDESAVPESHQSPEDAGSDY